MSAPSFYQKQMKDKFGCDVVWPPNYRVELGDYGKFTRRTWRTRAKPFQKLGNIRDDEDLQVPFQAARPGPKMNMETLVSEHVTIAAVEAGVDPETKVGLAKVAGTEVGVRISFARNKSVVYHGSDVQIHEIAELQKLAENISAHECWDPNWFVVTRIHETQGLTVILSYTNKGFDIEIRGNADLTPGNLARAAASIHVATNRSGKTNYISSGACTPLMMLT
jgi:hypothetical protein